MQGYSRRQTVEAKENKRRAIGFVLLSLAVIAFMFYFGLPLLVRVSNFVYDLRGSGEPIVSGDTTPPPPPTFEGLPDFTSKETIEIKGYSEPGVSLTIFVNTKTEEILVNNEGSFSKEITLLDGRNLIYGRVKDSAGNESRDSRTLTVTLDKEKPTLEILTPKNGESFSGSRDRQINIEGTTEAEAQIFVNGHLVIVDSSGKFVYPTGLAAGENKFTIKSQDQAGNSIEQELVVNYYP